MPQYKGAERRRFIRIPYWFVTKYRIYPYELDSATEKYRYGTGKNISAGGICFEAEDGFRVSTLLEVELDMPALDHAVRVVGKIAWAKAKEEQEKRFIYGVEFTKINNEDIEAVKKIVETFS